ncbi:MAG: carboxypeptidase regulatory-like domain-containing protein [Chloroflexi bacterium]|nr:carboxypeptidase regulatory-like domain-containing protein [Chloroflexota bacterium]
MSFTSPLFTIPRQSIHGMEGMWAKMWDPPRASPPTPDLLAPTNVCPEVMAAAGLQKTPSTPHTVMRDLLHGADIPTWDGAKRLKFFLFRDGDNPATGDGNFPGATIRVPRGVIFHGETKGHGPPPHTIHWHGIEPTPCNDGVGHCSMEIGDYTYQWQPNFIGFYFCHCHRNTVQHFEYGLYQALLIDPADAYFATLVDPTIPIGAGRDRKRRIAANLRGTSLVVLQDNFNPLDTPDPWTGDPRLKFPTDPHAFTVPFDVEALWVVDDRDSRWSDLAPNAKATYPHHGASDTAPYIPGVNDGFHNNGGSSSVEPGDFFAFNDFNADYWFVTGVPVPAPRGGTGTIPAGIVIPPALISGTATQVSVQADVGQTILVRCLDAAYNNATIRFPVPVTVIAWDGRALGVPPYGQYNHAYDVPANTPIKISVARRFDALMKVDTPFNGFAEVDFSDTRGGRGPDTTETVLCTARIPIDIRPVLSGTVTSSTGAPLAGVAVTATTGNVTRRAVTDAAGAYRISGLAIGSYGVTPSLVGYDFTPRSRVVTLSGATVTGQDFVGTPVGAGTYSISGAVTGFGGVPLAAITVKVRRVGTRTVVTDASGSYSIAGLANGNYRVMPVVSGFTFEPRSRVVTVSGANVSGQNFVATQKGAGAWSISGNITNAAGAPMAGVEVRGSGAKNRTARTDASGNYTLVGLRDGNYSVRPRMSGGVNFTPRARVVTVSGANVSGQNFVAG